MSKNLVIVESPAKAKTIEKFLGKDFIVKSSFGHVRDLPKKGLNIDVEHNFKPTYAISPDKKKVVSELKQAAKTASDVWLASDEDREGEAIAWHLTQALGLDPKKTKRIVFHEITKTAIDAAIKKPRLVDDQLVNAQQARRVLDRLVGYELSPVLWKKVRSGLSAGRVQSVAVRLIVEREREIKSFEAVSSYKVTAQFKAEDTELSAELDKKLNKKEEASKFLEDIKKSSYKVSAVEQKPSLRNPSAPFTTSSLQQEAARRLGFSVRQTMTLAQRLYEAGLITYMRTDSTVLSEQALTTAKQYILKQYGGQYHKRRQYQTKNQSAQEAHEAIRPTDFNITSAPGEPAQQKLYQLIWQRALASQMSPAKTEKTEISIAISNRPELFLAKGEVLKFDGFMKVYGGTKDDTILPALKQGQALDCLQVEAREVFSRPPARYSEASLVRKLEELGIGRPSTYAPTISTVQSRGYVEKSDIEGNLRRLNVLRLNNGQIKEAMEEETTGADRNKLVPTPLAEVTTDFLVKYFPSIVNYDFTAQIEASFDKIAAGQEAWVSMIKQFYSDFHPLIAQSESVSREEVSKARLVGTDPATKKPILARFGRYGPMLQRGEAEGDEKPDFAPLPAKTTIESVTLEEALEAFQLPRQVGTTEDGQTITANIGRFGPYIQVNKIYVSIKPLDPHTITEEEARQLYVAKLQKEADKYIKKFKSGIQILNGPYGPYISNGKKNVSLGSEVEPANVTEAEAKRLLAAAPAKKRFQRQRRASSKT